MSGRSTPWGKAQTKEVLVPGITFYSTAGHGGYFVTKHVRAVMRPELVNEDGWYEEDMEWIKVAIAFPHLFTEAIVKIANDLYKKFYNEKGEFHASESVSKSSQEVLLDRGP